MPLRLFRAMSEHSSKASSRSRSHPPGYLQVGNPTPNHASAVTRAASLAVAEKPIGALRASKRLMREGEQLKQVMDRESAVFAERLKSPEAAEAFRAFAEKRAPNFARFS